MALLVSIVVFQSCKEDEVKADPPTLTGPTSVASVQVGTSADVTFTFEAPAGYESSSVVATGGTAIVSDEPDAKVESGAIVVQFTAGNSAGAGSVTLTLVDADGNEVDETAVLNITISAPPSVTLDATAVSVAAGSTVDVIATITAANGAKNITYTTTGGLTGSPVSPISIAGSPTAATQQTITFTVPANAAVNSTLTALITGSDNQNLNSSAVLFTVTVTDVANLLQGTLTTNKTLTEGTPWTIKGQYIVNSGVTLTVEPGAIIKGDKATKGLLIIKPGGKLVAVGTALKPIVFTSSQPVNERDRGDWGGIVWLGNAFVNQSSAPAVEGVSPAQTYGTPSTSDANAGSNTEDNGKLKYARIEYAGIELSPNNETNSLTMGALGNATEIEYVQTSYGGDDAFEWFGGTVNAKYLVSLATWDDDFDTDFGWRGNVQFGVAIRAPFIADQSGSTAFESDSQANANPIGTICTDGAKSGCTQGVFSNMTVYGPRDYSRSISGSYTRAVHIRRRTAVSIFNSVITGFLQGIQLDDLGTTTNYSTTYDGTTSASTTLGKLANNELYVSLLPNTPSDIGTNATAVTSMTSATGNGLFGVGGGATANYSRDIFRTAGALNNDYAPIFISTWASSGAGQAFRNSWQAAVGTITDPVDPATKTTGTIAFAQGVDGISVNGASSGTWTEGTTVNLVNPYAGSGFRTTPFYAGSSASSYTANPDFTLNSADATATGKRLDQGGTFTDARLSNGNNFTWTSTTYRGAFNTTDWTDGWCEFVPLTKVY